MAFDALDSFDWISQTDPGSSMYKSGWWIADWLNATAVGTLGVGRKLTVASGGNYGRIGRTYSATQGKSFGAHVAISNISTAQNYCDIQFFYDPAGGGNGGNSKGQIGFYFATDGSIKVYRGENLASNSSCVLLGTTAAGLFTNGVEFAFETEFKIDNTAGRVKIWVNNVVVLDLTGIDTQHQTAALVNGFANWGLGTKVWDWDDMWCWDNDTKPTVSPMRATQLLPAADGGTLGLTPSTGTSHVAMVNEATVNLMTADWLTGTAAGQTDILTLADLGKIPNQIPAVQLVAWANKLDIAPRDLNLGVEHGGNISDGPNIPLSATQTAARRIMTADALGAAWTRDSINAMNLRLKVAA